MKKFEYLQSNGDNTLFYKHSQIMKDMILVGYVDKIIISWSDPQERTEFGQELMNEFSLKSLGQMAYFLGIEIAHSSKEILLSQQKYTLDLNWFCRISTC